MRDADHRDARHRVCRDSIPYSTSTSKPSETGIENKKREKKREKRNRHRKADQRPWTETETVAGEGTPYS